MHALTDPTLLLPLPKLLTKLCVQEATLDNPACTGHNTLQPSSGPAYQDVLVALIQDHAHHTVHGAVVHMYIHIEGVGPLVQGVDEAGACGDDMEMPQHEWMGNSPNVGVD